MAAAPREDLEQIVGPLGFFRAKTESLLKLSAALVERYDGEVPPRLDDLVTLPGVGRKTANVVLGNAFGIPGITVDTHFGRLARRLGWTEETDPVKVEHAVGALFPKRDWTMLSHHLIWHGRRVCHAKKPACGACPVARWCPSYGEGPADPEVAAALVKTQGPGMRRAVLLVAGRRRCCSPARRGAGGPRRGRASRSPRPQLRALKAAGRHRGLPTGGTAARRGRTARVTLPASPAGPTSTSPPCGARRGQPLGELVRAVPRGAARTTQAFATQVRRQACASSASTSRRPERPGAAAAQQTGVTYPLVADPGGRTARTRPARS